ncbi:MAG: hypothetical protein ACRD0J_01350, partial [Acidimicrobiales bacterium]
GPDRRRAPGRTVTVRVVAFVTVVVLVVAGIVAAVEWYARDAWYVGLSGTAVVVYQGHPGGFLWFQPRVVYRPGLTTAGVLPSRWPDLRKGMVEPSLAAADQYVSNLAEEAKSLGYGTGTSG